MHGRNSGGGQPPPLLPPPSTSSSSIPTAPICKVFVSDPGRFTTLYYIFFVLTVVEILAHVLVFLAAILLPWFITTASFLVRSRSTDWTILLLWLGCLFKIIIYVISLLVINPTVFGSNGATSELRKALERASGYNVVFLVFALISLGCIIAVNITLFVAGDPFTSPSAAVGDYNAERLILILTYLYALTEVAAIVAFFIAIRALSASQNNVNFTRQPYSAVFVPAEGAIYLTAAPDRFYDPPTNNVIMSRTHTAWHNTDTSNTHTKYASNVYQRNNSSNSNSAYGMQMPSYNHNDTTGLIF